MLQGTHSGGQLDVCEVSLASSKQHDDRSGCSAGIAFYTEETAVA